VLQGSLCPHRDVRSPRPQRREVWASYGSSNFFRSNRVTWRSLDLLDANGASLLHLKLPLKPAEASVAFEASAPVWTKRAFEVEQVNK
jgi:hypothetical protein